MNMNPEMTQVQKSPWPMLPTGVHKAEQWNTD